MDTTSWRWQIPDDPRLLSGRDLRYQLTQILTERGPTTVAELAQVIGRLGFRLADRPSKVISDALRWEIARGRVVKTGRGSYRLGVVPRSTAYRIARRSRDLRSAVAAFAPARSSGEWPPVF